LGTNLSSLSSLLFFFWLSEKKKKGKNEMEGREWYLYLKPGGDTSFHFILTLKCRGIEMRGEMRDGEKKEAGL
jgi:hypothetical protein